MYSFEFPWNQSLRLDVLTGLNGRRVQEQVAHLLWEWARDRTCLVQSSWCGRGSTGMPHAPVACRTEHQGTYLLWMCLCALAPLCSQAWLQLSWASFLALKRSPYSKVEKYSHACTHSCIHACTYTGSDWSRTAVETELGMKWEADALSAVTGEFNFKFSQLLKSNVPRKWHVQIQLLKMEAPSTIFRKEMTASVNARNTYDHRHSVHQVCILGSQRPVCCPFRTFPPSLQLCCLFSSACLPSCNSNISINGLNSSRNILFFHHRLWLLLWLPEVWWGELWLAYNGISLASLWPTCCL